MLFSDLTSPFNDNFELKDGVLQHCIKVFTSHKVHLVIPLVLKSSHLYLIYPLPEFRNLFLFFI
jgi:hypothetical protein